MLSILHTVLPVFLLVGAGFCAVRFKVFPDSSVAGLVLFTQNFAMPSLLFLGLYRLDFDAVFDPRLIFSFYFGAIFSFALGYFVARKLFRRRPGESVAIGFAGLFSNAVLLGLPIMERAYGAESLAANYALIAIHAPVCYFIGITAMEIARADGRSFGATARVTIAAMFRNTITIACGFGVLMNFLAIPLPVPVESAVGMLASATLPVALFGLGGVLTRYRIRSSLGEALAITFIATIIHPSIAFVLTHHVFGLDPAFVRSATVMAAMGPGANAYVFASMYDRATGEVASTVVIATAVSAVTAAGWLWLLGGAAIG
ncbi:MAG: AEC family transporter [Paracoccaceae bacterium]